jgi:hypothetical protein
MGVVINATPRPLSPRKRTDTHYVGDWVVPPESVWTGAENSPPPGYDSRTVQPVASRYTYYAISRNYCCRRKAISIIYFCVCVCECMRARGREILARMALLIQPAARIRHVVCDLSGSTTYLGALATFLKATSSFVSVRPSVRLSFRLSAWNDSAPTGRILMKFYIWAFAENLPRKFSFH